jgi:hypothetical protein
MNAQKPILFVVTLALISATAGFLAHAKSTHRLGDPGVKTQPLPGSHNLEVLIPEDVPGYTSKWVPQAAIVTNLLPQDTSFGQRLYTAPDGFQALANTVLMGSSRASIHEPQICLAGQGWTINDAASSVVTLPMDRPVPYTLPVMRLMVSRVVEYQGQHLKQSGIYIYWFVDDNHLTATHAGRNIWMARDILFRNVVDRWAYIAFFAVCEPGQEDATFERMKKLIVAAVPEFQLVPTAAK